MIFFLIEPKNSTIRIGYPLVLCTALSHLFLIRSPLTPHIEETNFNFVFNFK